LALAGIESVGDAAPLGADTRMTPAAHTRGRGVKGIADTPNHTDGATACPTRRPGSRQLPKGFAIYLASKDGYEDSMLPNGGLPAPQDTLNCAYDLYLDPDI
jgi:hypothetical protein